ncbi:cellulose synthase-like protein G2 [Cynara cardunculus var. scolymus]|uniref:cellulose synthase-like protein G2 n=1 Tax=Cynara cardunculus var. scolymus TaxID=59895 RepID=UPI000D62E9AE|nr:cellulose synthase-like protein G2 [Cynara cardunculus var. scolymus]
MKNQNHPPPFHRRLVLRRRWFNRIFAVIYTCTVFTFLLHQTTLLLFHTTNITISLIMLLADIILAFMWFTHQGFRMNPVHRKTFPENLPKDETKYPAMDVFICTADPDKEPPMVAVNTALSIMGFDYPTEKLSVYLSDDGGSRLTLLAFMEAAKFARHWIPYCKENQIMDRSPEAYFTSNYTCFPRTHEIKVMYDSMKDKVEKGVATGSDDVYQPTHIFNQWDANFTRQHHPTVIQVLLDGTKETDVLGHAMPNLIYVSREKRKATPHHFKAGALNVLLRVSETITNAPIVLTVDCDMYSNDPKTPLKALCYFLNPSIDSDNIAFLQFPQIFQGINQDDIYGAEFKFIFQINMTGFDGLLGPSHVGTGCFFRRRAFYGNPSSQTLEQTRIQSIRSDMLSRCHEVAKSNFEAQTKWGYELGYRYGSMLEDFDTGYHLHCKGWRSVFCLPNRPAFLGTAPMNLHDLLNQTQRWSMGLLDMNFSRYNPIKHGCKHLPLFQALCYTHYISWPIWCIPLLIYSHLPQLALIHSLPIFPKVSDPWFLLYAFLFIGAYGQDFLEFKLGGGTARGWYNNQRAWIIRSLSSYTYAVIEYMLTKLCASSAVFNVTSKVVDEEASTRYKHGMVEFGVESLFFYPISVAALLNLIALIFGVMGVFKHGGLQDLFLQFLLVGFGVVNSWPVYQAMVLRNDPGKMPLKITLTSFAIASMLYLVAPKP